MADLVNEQHAQAALALLALDVGLRVYDGRVPDTYELPYVLVYTTVSRPRDGAANPLNAQSATYRVEWNCHCVGEDAIAARAVQMRVDRALVDQRPTIASRQCGLIKQEEVLAPNRDETTGRLVMDGVSIYSLFTAPG